MKRPGLWTASSAALLLLYLFFIGSAAAVLILGIKAQDFSETLSERSFGERMALAYLAEKLRQSDGCDIYTGDFGGSNALFIESTYEGILYTDIIYGYDGHLCELFCEKGANFSPEDGSVLTEVGAVTFTEPADGLVRIEITDINGKTTVLNIFLRSGGWT